MLKHAFAAPAAVVACVLLLVLGLAYGSSAGPAKSLAPRQTVTKTVTATATVTKTVTATATVTAPGPTTTVTVPGPTVTVTGTPTASSTPTPTPTPTSTPTAPAGGVCTTANAYTDFNGDRYDWTDNAAAPGFSGGGSGGMDEYYVSSDMWAAGGTNMLQHTVFCQKPDGSPFGFFEDTVGGDGSVKSYPNAHTDFHHWGTGAERPFSDLPTLTSTFSHISPASCLGCSYDWAYDVWINNYDVELMIWTDYKTQDPAFVASLVDTVTIDGQSWKVYKSGTYIALVPANGVMMTSGNVDLKAFLNYVSGKGWVGSTPTLSAVAYGVEVCNTANQTKRFDLTGFSVTPLPHLVY